jgi:Helix-turn-helix of DDE superfamily endonuclease
MEALPIQPHDFHAAWNYTIHPGTPAKDGGDQPPALTRRAAVLRMLADPRLTGMHPQDLHALARQLAPAQAAAREQRCYQQRGAPRRKAPGNHGHPILTDPDRVLVTVIYLRPVCSQQVLADLLEVTQAAIGPAIKETRRLLEEHRHAIEPTMLRLTRAQEVVDYARTGTLAINAVRSRRYQQLSDPALTGIPRRDLDRLVDRLSVRQAALVERRRHQRRGGARLPGTRGGIFRQKITDAERILTTILHLRQVCTQQALADLFDVTRGTIRNAFADVLPLLEQDGLHLPPASSRLRSAADVLASIAPQDDASTNPKPPR